MVVKPNTLELELYLHIIAIIFKLKKEKPINRVNNVLKVKYIYAIIHFNPIDII